MGKNKLRLGTVAIAAIAATLALASNAQAALTLTAAGTSNGFSLSTFYSEPNAYYGALGSTTMSNGRVLVSSYQHGQLLSFSDVDGQTYGSALASVSTPGSAYGVATVGGQSYFSTGTGGGYYKVDATTLALTPLAVSGGLLPYLGLWGNQATGHLLSSSYAGLVDINPLTGAYTVVDPTVGYDGVSVSPDGLTAYGYISGTVRSFNIATHAAGTVFSAPAGDGTGVISGGALNGQIIVNNVDGTVGLINPATGIQTIIASGGQRGDFTGPDLTNGTLFLSSADQMYRLAVAGGAIGGGPPVQGGVPEPSSWALMLLGFGGLGAVLRRRRGQVALTA